MIMGAAGHSANFDFMQKLTAQIHRKIRINARKRKRRENPFSLEIWGPYKVDP
jgi:hypothetical protein